MLSIRSEKSLPTTFRRAPTRRRQLEGQVAGAGGHVQRVVARRERRQVGRSARQ